MYSMALRIGDARIAFRLLSDIRRVADSSVWGDVIAVAVRGGVLLLIPVGLWESLVVREIAKGYGATLVATEVDAGDVAMASTGVRLDLHPDDPRLRRSVRTLLEHASTSWAQVRSGAGAAARSGELLARIETGMRRTYPEISIVPDPPVGDSVTWHIYRDHRDCVRHARLRATQHRCDGPPVVTWVREACPAPDCGLPRPGRA